MSGDEIALELSRIVREAEARVERRMKELQLGELFFDEDKEMEMTKAEINCMKIVLELAKEYMRQGYAASEKLEKEQREAVRTVEYMLRYEKQGGRDV